MHAVGIPSSAPARRQLAWVSVLAFGQLADLLTTQVAMSRGGIEANQVAAALLATGGIGLLWVVKALLVAAMGAAVWLVRQTRSDGQDQRWAFADAFVWRGLQLCAVVLSLTALHNLTVIAQLGS